MPLASATDVVGSSGVLGFILGGGLLTAIIGGYRFMVNFRLSERGLARDRVDQAVQDQRAERAARLRAERESALWQSRCGDLEYALRQAGAAVPPISSELHALAFSGTGATLEARKPKHEHHRRNRNARGDPLSELENRLRRQELDEAHIVTDE